MLVITIARPGWIELVFRVDPDHRSGLFEILIVCGLIVAGAAMSLAARAQRRRADPLATPLSRDDDLRLGRVSRGYRRYAQASSRWAKALPPSFRVFRGVTQRTGHCNHLVTVSADRRRSLAFLPALRLEEC